MFTWNPVFNFVLDIKRKYKEKFGTVEYKEYVVEEKTLTCLEYWIEMLNDNAAKEKIKYLEINQSNSLVLIRYAKHSSVSDGQYEITAENLWEIDGGFYLECRSIVIDLKEECIVISPFKKFRNLNECPANELSVVIEEIKNAKTIEITNKLDGSMQCARWYKGKLFMTGSQAIELEKSWRLADGYRMMKSDINCVKMVRENPDYTFIFEYISLADAHVVKYEKHEEGLYLIGVRHVYSGRQLSYKEVADLASKYNVKMTQIYDKTFDEILQEVKFIKSDDQEGFVVNIDGHMIKVKGDDYVKIHKILSQISSINLIIQSIAENRMDDLLSKVPEAYKPRVRKVSKVVYDYIAKMEEEVNKYYEFAPKDDRKTFMIWTETSVPVKFKKYVRNKYIGVKNNYLKYGNDKCPGYIKLNQMGVTDYKTIFTEDVE